MANTITTESLTVTDLMIAMSEYLPDTNYGAVRHADQRYALDAYLAFEDGSLAEVPQALNAYMQHQQSCLD